jgi:hypothetical protein
MEVWHVAVTRSTYQKIQNLLSTFEPSHVGIVMKQCGVSNKGHLIQLRLAMAVHPFPEPLPPGNEALAAEIRAHKEKIRSLLRDRQNARRPRKAPVQAPPPPKELEPVYITPACRCSKHPFPHVHAPQPEPWDVVRFQDGSAMFDALKDLVAITRNKDMEDESMKWFTSHDANLPRDRRGRT